MSLIQKDSMFADYTPVRYALDMTVKPKSSKKTALLVTGVTVGVTVVVISMVLIGTFLTNNFTGSGSNSRACTALLGDTILSVSGVESATVECNLQFGGGWQRATVRMNTSDQTEAQAIATNVIKAYASQKAVADLWSTPHVYLLKDGSMMNSLAEFNGVPNVRDVREHYNIQP